MGGGSMCRKVPLDFWREFREEVLRVKPDAYIVAEVWRGTAPWLRATRFTA